MSKSEIDTQGKQSKANSASLQFIFFDFCLIVPITNHNNKHIKWTEDTVTPLKMTTQVTHIPRNQLLTWYIEINGKNHETKTQIVKPELSLKNPLELMN